MCRNRDLVIGSELAREALKLVGKACTASYLYHTSTIRCLPGQILLGFRPVDPYLSGLPVSRNSAQVYRLPPAEARHKAGEAGRSTTAIKQDNLGMHACMQVVLLRSRRYGDGKPIDYYLLG